MKTKRSMEKRNDDRETGLTPLPSIKKNTFYNMLKTFSTIIFPLITFPYISRVLGVENIGKINFGSTIASYVSLVATLGITIYAIRQCSRIKGDRDELGRTASEIFSINIVTTVVAYIALIVCFICVPALKGYRQLIIIQASSVFFSSVGADWLNTAMEDFRFITVRTFAFQLISLLAMFLFVHQREHYIIYAIISVLSSSGGNIANIFYRRKYCKVHFTLHMNWKKHFPPIMMLFAMQVAQSILGQLDIAMIGFMQGDYDVGLYSACVRITNIIFQVVGAIVWVTLPQVSLNYQKKDYEAVSVIIKKAATFTIVIGLPCLTGLLFLAPDMLWVLGGSEFVSAQNCLRLLGSSMMFAFLGNIYGLLCLIPTGKENWLTFASVVGAVFNGITNMIFIPVFGIYGAALTTLLSSAITLPIYIYAKTKTPINVKFVTDKDIMVSPIIGCLLISVICFFGKKYLFSAILRLVVVVPLSVIAYGVVLLVTKYDLLLSVVVPIVRKVKKVFVKNE